MPASVDYGVFEMGMNHPGELAHLTTLVRPHVAIVTAIAPAHAAFFPDESAIADAKGEIFQGLEPGGVAIVPYDSPHRDRLIAARQAACRADRDVRHRRGRRRRGARSDRAPPMAARSSPRASASAS